jgi:hypothetical protein
MELASAFGHVLHTSPTVVELLVVYVLAAQGVHTILEVVVTPLAVLMEPGGQKVEKGTHAAPLHQFPTVQTWLVALADALAEGTGVALADASEGGLGDAGLGLGSYEGAASATTSVEVSSRV